MIPERPVSHDLRIDQRDGKIPGWGEVRVFFDEQFKDMTPDQIRLTRFYYRAQKRFAQGADEKGKRTFHFLKECYGYEAFEDKYGNLLTSIADKVRKKR